MKKPAAPQTQPQGRHRHRQQAIAFVHHVEYVSSVPQGILHTNLFVRKALHVPAIIRPKPKEFHRKLRNQLYERMLISNAPVDGSTCLRNTSSGDKRHFHHQPGYEYQYRPKEKKRGICQYHSGREAKNSLRKLKK